MKKTRRAFLLNVIMYVLWFAAIPMSAITANAFGLSEVQFVCLMLGAWTCIGVIWAHYDERFNAQNASPSNTAQKETTK